MDDESTPLFTIRPLIPADRNWVAHFMDTHWGSTKIVSRGQVHYGHLLDGFVAELSDAPDDAPPIGLITYRPEGKDCEIVTIDSLQPGLGVGTALVNAVRAAARELGCERVWVITTNDNLNALRFYQKRGFRLVAVYADALAASRKLKPQIPLVGKNGIPLRDEIELESGTEAH